MQTSRNRQRFASNRFGIVGREEYRGTCDGVGRTYDAERRLRFEIPSCRVVAFRGTTGSGNRLMFIPDLAREIVVVNRKRVIAVAEAERQTRRCIIAWRVRGISAIQTE